MKLYAILAAMIGLAFSPEIASALTVVRSVSPQSAQHDQDQLSVDVEIEDNGLIKFTITRHDCEQMYFQSHLTLRHDSKVLAANRVASYMRTGDAKFFVSIAPKMLADSTLTISENRYQTDGDRDHPVVGGIIYKIQLNEFAAAMKAVQD